MGQYYKGEKIGTCESMYYMRLEEAQELANLGASDDDGISFSSMLTDNATMFRFPFPDEDTKSDSHMHKITARSKIRQASHDKGYTIPATTIEFNHTDKCIPVSVRDGRQGFNMFIPCPYSEEFAKLGLKTSSGGVGNKQLIIKYQAMRDVEDKKGFILKEEKTIFECAQCGQLQRLDTGEVKALKEELVEYYNYYKPRAGVPNYGDQAKYDNGMKLIERIK